MYAITMQVTSVIQKITYCQPDAKLLNGLHWTKIWIWVATNPQEALETVKQVLEMWF